MEMQTDSGEPNHSHGDHKNNAEDGYVGEGRYVFEEDVQSNIEVPIDAENGLQGATETVPLISQQQAQGPAICWERFLHLRSLKVLLAESDACTRQIVAALLRNCSYEVVEAINGLQAWEILEDLTNHIDLVLTEVTMPCILGVALLCKIMSHKSLKTIPVIMMSSHGSMGLVFKCLSRGAADFLVKPLRKNELKNLWQHVWRRCHSPSGSGSDSDTQSKNSIKSKSGEIFENNTATNDEDGNWSIGLNRGDGCDNRSGTQGTRTNKAVEVDSPQSVAPRDQGAKYPDSVAASAIHIKAEIYKLVTLGRDERSGANNTKESASVEFSLEKLGETTSMGATVQDDHNVLQHLDLLASTRHNVSAAANNLCVNVRNGSSNGNNSDTMKGLLVHENSSHSIEMVSKYCKNQGNSSKDAENSVISSFTKPVSPEDRTAASLCPSAIFHSVTAMALRKGSQLNQEQNPSHHSDHHSGIAQTIRQQHQLPLDQCDCSLEGMAAAAAGCGSSGKFDGAIEGIAGNCCTNGNVSNCRDMALADFCHKKKDRCYQEVYQSRKRLAVECPSVEGQLGRHKLHENMSVSSDG